MLAFVARELLQGRTIKLKQPHASHLVEPVFAAVREHFSGQEIVETIVAIGFYMMMARLTEATEVDLDPAAGMTVFEGGQKRSG